MNIVLGIGGHKNCGKDITAKIFAYINYVGSNNANYHDYIINQQQYDLTTKKIIIHFADILKDNLSKIFCIPRELFDKREYKDELWYDYRRNDFIEQKWITNEHRKLYIDDFKELDSFKKLIAQSPDFPCFKIRTLMQIYGELMRKTFGDNIWVDSTVKQASKIALGNKLGIISDVRYINEAIAISSTPFFTGKVVRIFRDITDNNEIDDHPSEEILFNSDYTINNNTTIINLFYQCLEIYKKLEQL